MSKKYSVPGGSYSVNVPGSQNQEISVYFAPEGTTIRDKDFNWYGPEEENQGQRQPLTESKKRGSLALGTIGFQLGRMGLTTVAGRVGNYTGNQMMQNKLHNTTFMMETAGAIAMAAAGNPIPLIMSGFTTAVRVVDYQMTLTKANAEASALKDLVGYSATNRGRGTGGKV